MCGICGAIQVSGEARPLLEDGRLDVMTDLMTHRGPNDRGIYRGEGVALGVRRLSIIDVEGGHQPFADERREIWAIQNGELYNHPELRDELASQGHRFASRCDTEILPHLYEREGDGLAARLRGKFAFAVWDERRRRAVIARDRLGVKPLYYAVVDDVLVFASELKSVLASGLVGFELNYEAIDAYLTLGFFPGRLTPLAAVSKLLPAHALVVGDGGIRENPYWDLPFPEEPARPLREEEYSERFLAELEEAVRLRLMSDVPLGAMLSGGLDSSVLVALMARNMTEPVRTFSIGFIDDERGNELADARLVATALGTHHNELELSFSEQAIPLADLSWHLDEPLADLSSLGLYALSRLAAEQVTVALSGQGADELLGGYSVHRNAALAGVWQRLPRPLRSVGASAAAFAPPRLRRVSTAITASSPADRLLVQYTRIDEDLRRRLVRGPLAEARGGAEHEVARALGGQRGTPLAMTLYLRQQLGLVDDMLHYFDRVSMAHSLEVRVPFLDHHVVEFCARLPSSLKVSRLTGKYLLRRLARDLIPAPIIEKQKVGFFSAAVADWFQAQTDHAVADYLLQPEPASRDLFDRTEVAALVRAHAARPGSDSANLLLAILMLEVWLSDTVPRALAASTRSPERATPPA